MRLSNRSTSPFSELTAPGDRLPTGEIPEALRPLAQHDDNADDGQGHASEDDPEL